MPIKQLDPRMIENPAIFRELSARRLSADLINPTDITGSGILQYPTGYLTNVFAVGLSTQRLSATNTSTTNLTSVNAYIQNLTADNLKITNVSFDETISNALYVSTSGSNSNTGRTMFDSLSTIKKACEIAHNDLVSRPSARYTIFVGTGDYNENNPIFVPPNVSIIGDNLRRTSIFPQNPNNDILWCNNSNYVWGFTFRGHKNGAAATAFPNFSNPTLTAIALQNLATPTAVYNGLGGARGAGWKKPYIITSPYIQGCSSITNATGAVSAGCGMKIDGNLAEGYLRSFVLDSYTQFNEGGKGIHILNNGYAQLVSIFTICCTEGVHAETGGSCSINTSNCSFGLSGLVATGKSLTPVLTGSLVQNPQNTTTVLVNQVSGTVLYPDSIAPSIANAPYNGLVFTIGSNPTVHIIEGNPFLSGGNYNVTTTTDVSAAHAPGESVNFYIRSTITSSSHTFEYIGTGIVLANAVPARGGVSNPDLEVVYDDVGIVYFTSTNQAGNFRVGKDFTILQETGTIEGDTFKRSIVSLVTPLVLSLE